MVNQSQSLYSKKMKKKTWIAFLYLIPIIWMSFEPSKNYPFFNIPFIGYIVAIFALLLVSTKYLMEREFWFAIIYGIVVFFNFWRGNEAFPSLFSVLYEVFRLMIPAALFFYFKSINQNKPLVYSIFVIYLFIIIYETIITYELEQINPGLMRNLGASKYDEDRDSFLLMGLTPYSLPHALPTVIPAIILLIKEKDNKFLYRIGGLLFLMASLVIIYLSQATGAYLMAIFALVASIIVNNNQDVKINTRKIIITAVIVLPLLMIPAFTDFILSRVESVISTDSDVYEKIEELKRSNAGMETEGDIAYRGELLNNTIEAIIQHPLLGSPTRTYGNHNALLDRWAKLGLVGFLPLILFLIYTIKKCYRILPEKGKIYYVIGVVTAIAMLFFKNQISWDQWFLLFYLLPVIICYNYMQNGFKKTSDS